MSYCSYTFRNPSYVVRVTRGRSCLSARFMTLTRPKTRRHSLIQPLPDLDTHFAKKKFEHRTLSNPDKIARNFLNVGINNLDEFLQMLAKVIHLSRGQNPCRVKFNMLSGRLPRISIHWAYSYKKTSRVFQVFRTNLWKMDYVQSW